MTSQPHSSAPESPGEPADDGRIYIGSSEARDRLAALLNFARYQRRRFVVEKHGKPVAAVVPLEDLEALEAFEDRADRAKLEELDEEEMETVPLDEAEDEVFDDG